MTRKYTFTDNDLIKLREEGLSFPEIGKKLDISRELIKYHMNKLGFLKSQPDGFFRKRTKYSFDKYYFDDIDTSNKAYFLGLFYADGCNFRSERGASCVSLFLNHEDSYILEKLKNDIKSNSPIYINRGQSGFKINDRYLSESLSKKGVIPRKSLTLKWPSENIISKNLMFDFIRGYFDGDGCIYVTKANKNGIRCTITIISTKDFCDGLKKEFDKLNIKSYIYPEKNQFILRINRKEDINKIYNAFYNNDCSFLMRKYEKFKSYLQ